MGVKSYRPTSPGVRTKTTLTFDDLTKKRPERSLVSGRARSVGRNSGGRITSRHKGGGHKRLYRTIDFKRNKLDIPAKVLSLEYDPNRSARIALVCYQDGEKRYILAPHGLQVGDTVMAGEKVEIKIGHALPLANMPLGAEVHNVELRPGKGGQMMRSAGAVARVVAKESDYVLLKLVSGEVRRVFGRCVATIGRVGNLDHEKISIGKAGRSRWLGRRPHVRGVAMNPVDHPHGGGEGKAGAGNPHPVSPWGQLSKGYKTRRNKRTTRFIVTRRSGTR